MVSVTFVELVKIAALLIETPTGPDGSGGAAAGVIAAEVAWLEPAPFVAVTVQVTCWPTSAFWSV